MKSRGSRFAVIAAAAISAVVGARAARAADLTWTPTDPANAWSTAGNWDPAQVPGAADVAIFTATGAAAAQGAVTNVVDTNFTLTGVRYRQTANTGQFHTTQIGAGVTLTLDDDGDILYVGTGEGASNLTSVVTTITGDGTLNLDNDGGTVHVRQGMTGNTSGNAALRATLDMSGLANLTANVDEFEIGEGGSSTSQINRAAGTVLLAKTSNITAGDVTVGFQSASGGNQSQLLFGQNTTINTALLELGVRKGSGMAAFQGGVTGGSLVIRGVDGQGRANVSIAVGQVGDGTGSAAGGFIDLTADAAATPARGGGTIDARVGTLLIGRGSGGTANNTGRLTYDAGTVDATQVILGETGNGTGSGRGILQVLGTGQLNVGGDVVLSRTANDQGTLTVNGAGAAATIGGSITEGGTSTINVVDGALSAARIGSAANPITNLTVNNATLAFTLDTATAGAHVETLTADGANLLGVKVAGVVAPGTYALLDYAAVAGSGVGTFALGKLPARMQAVLVDNAANTSLDLNVTAFDSPKWRGNVNGDWNINTTANWQLINAGTATTYQEDLATYATADNVRFDDTADTGAVNVAATVAPGSVTVENGALAYTFGGAGAIVGTAPLTKSGNGTLTIANTGGNAVGAIALTGGTLQIGDNATPGGGAGSYGGVTTAGGTSLVFAPAAGDSTTFGGVISGDGEVKHTGAGATRIAGGNTYTGQTTITNGVVTLANANGFGPTGTGTGAVVIDGGTVDFNGGATIDFRAGKEFRIKGAGVDGQGAIINSAPDKDTDAQNNALNRLTLDGDAAIGGTGRFDIRNSGATLNLNNFTLTKKGTGQFSMVATHVGDGNIVVEAGTLSIETSSTVAGGGTITYNAGTTGQFYRPTGDVSRAIVANGATFTDASQANAVTIASPITMNADNTFQVNSSTGFTFAGAIGGAGGMTKTGGGTMALSGANTFTGKIAAVDGKLDLLSSQVGSSSLEASGDAVIELADNGGAADRVVKTGTLAITETARVDIKNNKLITSTPAGTATGGVYAEGSVHRMVQTAYQESSWSGPGLTTSMDDAKSGLTTVAIATGEQMGVSTFAGQSVAPTDTVAFYTYGGDTNFDGKLDADDYGTIDFNVLLPGPIDGYYNGDFNYDGVVNADDYGVIDFNILAQTTPFPTGGDDAIAVSSAGLGGVTAVPEPASLSVLGLGAASLLGRRRRRNQ